MDSLVEGMLLDKYSEFNKEGTDLRKLQERMLDIMEQIDLICRRNNIPYWLSSGTVLGAVRHKGFIPWDDDMDIEVLRKDYKRLLGVLSRELPSSMVVQTLKTDPYYVFPYAKVRDLHSRIVEDERLDYKYNGIFIDIFPMERCTKRISDISGRMHYWMLYRFTLMKEDQWGFKKGVIKGMGFLLNKIIYPFFRIFSFLSPKDNLRFILGMYYPSERRISEIFPLKDIVFENKVFPAPCNTDAYLTRLYGNYMELPPLDKIQPHITRVDFDINE